MENIYNLSFFNHEKDNVPQAQSLPWADLCNKLASPEIRAEKAGGELFSGATFKGTRAKNNVTELSLLVLDYDHAPDMAMALQAWQAWRHCAYTTYSHATPDKGNCYRVVIPLAAPIPAAMYPALWQWAFQRSGGLIDAACKDVSRIMYFPACPQERRGLFQFVQHEGAALDWQVLPLETTPDKPLALPATPRGDNPRFQKFCETALADEIRKVATAPEGTRNDTLNKAANALGQLVGSDWAAGYISVSEIERSLEAAATTAGLELAEIRRTIASGLAAGQKNPRKPPEDKPRNGAAIQGMPIATGGGNDWESPKPLPTDLLPVMPFDENLLPASVRRWCMDISERMQCPPDFVGVSIMAALGSVIGRKIGIRPQDKTDWTVTANQWALLIGRPGVMKSPAMEHAVNDLKRLAAIANDDFESRRKDYEANLKAAKLQSEAREKKARKDLAENPSADISGLLRDDDIEQPVARRYMTSNATAEALGELLRQNQNGLLVYRDELVSLLKTLDREDNAEARGFYLTGWNGDSGYTFDRIGRGLNLHIPAVCISLLGSTQPGKIAEYVRSATKGGAGDDGLIQRFGLTVWPDNGHQWKEIDRYPNNDAKRECSSVFNHLDAITAAHVEAMQDTDVTGANEGIPFLRFDNAGLRVFREWRGDFENRLRGGLHPAMESHLAKYRKLIPGLALIIHLAEKRRGAVGEDAVLTALAWAEYLESHAKRMYGSVTMPDMAAARAILAKIRGGELKDGFSRRDVYKNHWGGLDRESATAGLEVLCAYHWLQDETNQDTGGRYSTLYRVNPMGVQV